MVVHYPKVSHKLFVTPTHNNTISSYIDILYLVMFTVPSGPPSSVEVVETTPFSFTLSVSQPSPQHRNGIITTYTATVRLGGALWTRTVRLGQLLTFSSLLPYTTYRYAVHASTSAGSGPATPNEEVTTNETGELCQHSRKYNIIVAITEAAVIKGH